MEENIYEYTDEQQGLIDDLKQYISNNGVPKSADFTQANGLRNYNYYKKILNVKSLKDVFAMVGVTLSEEYIRMHHSERKSITDEELLDILKDYSDNVKFPVIRDFKTKNGLPGYKTYYNRFGSFKNAILLAGIEIPSDRKWLFERESLQDSEVKDKIKQFTDSYMEAEKRLPTYEVIKQNKQLPSTTVILKRFGSLGNLYKLIGYDLDYDDKMLKKELMEDYVKLAERIGKTPTSRDLDKYSLEGECCSAGSYSHHFGGIHELQLQSGLVPTDIGRKITDDELLENLSDLSERLRRVPMQKDFMKSNGVASVSVYNDKFGGFHNALKAIGFTEDEIGYKTYKTKNGTVCLSVYEYRFACLLESREIQFQKEGMYKDFIEDFERSYRFDFIINYNSRDYFIEIFGMVGNEKYDIRTKDKIRICKDNDVPLISLYPDTFWSTTQSELFSYLKEKMIEVDRIYYSDKVGDIDGKKNSI